MHTPILYQVIINRLKLNSFRDVLPTGKVRRVLTMIYKMPSNRVTSIITEMRDYGLIEIVNCREIKVLKTFDLP